MKSGAEKKILFFCCLWFRAGGLCRDPWQRLLLLSALVAFLPACNDLQTQTSTAPLSLAGATMGTRYLVKLSRLPHGVQLANVRAEVAIVLDEINRSMSTWRPSSELSRFNRDASTDWHEVSLHAVRVVSLAREISALTGGAFDITVAPLVDAWGFGPPGREQPRPDEKTIGRLLRHLGWKKIGVRMHPPALRKLDSQIRVDLAAIAKGYAVDQVAKILDRLSVPAYLVEIGGELRAKGRRPDGQLWQIGIERPQFEKRAVQRIISLENQAMATSGDYRNYRIVDGRRLSHTIDPRTGRPVEHQLAAVTVVEDSCARADALATGFMVLGAEEGMALAAQNHIAAFFLSRKRDDSFDPALTPTFQALVEGAEEP